MTELVDRLKRWRERNKLSEARTAQVLQKVGGVPVSPEVLRGWETGKCAPGKWTSELLETFLVEHPETDYRHGKQKLSTTETEQIRALRDQGLRLKEIAKKFGVSLSHVSQICAGNRWANSAGDN